MPLNSSVYPTHRTAAACEAKGCLVSISLGASEAHRDLAIEAYRWATMRYPEVTVCLGDGPLVKSTLRTLGCSQQQAIERGCELAHHSLDALNAVKPVASLLAASELATTELIQRQAKAGCTRLRTRCKAARRGRPRGGAVRIAAATARTSRRLAAASPGHGAGLHPFRDRDLCASRRARLLARSLCGRGVGRPEDVHAGAPDRISRACKARLHFREAWSLACRLS